LKPQRLSCSAVPPLGDVMKADMLAQIRAGVALGVAGLAAAAGCVIARALTAPYVGRQFTTRVHGVAARGGQHYVLLEDAEQTRQPGLYGAFLSDGAHILLGAEALSWGSSIARPVDRAAAERLAGVAAVSWTGIHFPTPTSAGLRAEEIAVPTELGPTPAWRFDAGDGDIWAVHIHGMGSTRAGTLRGVQVAVSSGLTSLVVTYRNTAEGIPHGSGRPTLGLDEARDVEPALEYALAHGARRIVLFGWSMGASIALQLADLSRWRKHVVGIVADSPVLDWRATLEANCSRAGLPSWSAHLAHPWLTRRLPARTIGLDRALDLDVLDWTRPGRLKIPLLILQGSADQSTPWQVAAALAEKTPLVTLVLFDADHTLSWNSDPERWRSGATDWLSKLLGLIPIPAA
jgi:pimeloyl-ACP methyl ester carboxylesterase